MHASPKVTISVEIPMIYSKGNGSINRACPGSHDKCKQYFFAFYPVQYMGWFFAYTLDEIQNNKVLEEKRSPKL